MPKQNTAQFKHLHSPSKSPFMHPATYDNQRVGLILRPAFLLLLIGLMAPQIRAQDPPKLKSVRSGSPEVRQLTFDGRIKHDPVFIEDGNAIVYTSLEKFNQLCLMKLAFKKDESSESRNKRKPIRFHPAANTSELMVSFANDENHYAYLRNNGNLHFEIITENKQTGKTTNYNPGGGFAGVRNVSMSPDGKQVIFAFPNRNGPQQIHTLQPESGKATLLTNSEGFDAAPHFSRDGKQIAFVSSRDGDFDLFIMNADGSSPVNLLKSFEKETRGLDARPRWSPDGRQIAYTSLRNGNYDIWVIDIRSGMQIRLTDHAETDDFPCWSPDGKSIVFVGERNGKRDLYQVAVSP